MFKSGNFKNNPGFISDISLNSLNIKINGKITLIILNCSTIE